MRCERAVRQVVCLGLRLLQEAEERRARFNRMLDDVHAEADREGYHTVDEVLTDIDAIIATHDDGAR